MNFLNVGNRIWIWSVLLWFFTTAASGQTTGTLIGTTRLADGAPLAGVVVSAESPNLQGTRTTTTGRGGVFRFAFLPAGPYTVTATADGMKTSRRNMVIGLSQVFQLDLVLEPSPTEESIEVTANVAATVTTSQVSANYSNDFIDKLPQARGLEGAALLAPGTTKTLPGNRLAVSGGPSFDNLYMINGSIANFDNISGRATGLVIEDALQELTVLSGSVSAEFGYFTGGVVNGVTRSGGNTFEGTLRFQFTNDDWRARTPLERESAVEREDDLSDLASAVLGGPIIKDRLWFFVAARNERNNDDTALFGAFSLNPAMREFLNQPQRSNAPPMRTVDAAFTDKRYEAKLTAALGRRHTATLSFMDGTNDRENQAGPSSIAFHESALLDSDRIEESLISLNYRFEVSDTFSLEAVFADKQTQLESEYFRLPITDPSQRAAATPIRGQLIPGQYNAPTLTGIEPDQRDNRNVRFKASYLWLPENLGIHNLSFGYQNNTDSRENNNLRSASGWLFFALTDWDENGDPVPIFAPQYPPGTRFPQSLLQHFVLEEPAFGSNFEIQSLYVNDEWVLNDHWQFNLGLRYDRNEAKSIDGTTVSEDDAVSPRLSARYIFQKGEYSHHVEGSYAHYVARLSDLANEGASRGRVSTISWLYGGPITNSVDEVFNWIDTELGTDLLSPENLARAFTISRPTIESQSVRIADDLKSPGSREWRIGYSLSRDARSFIKVDYLNRTYEDYLASFINRDLGTSPDGINNLTLIDNDPGFYQRDYDAVQVQMSWPLRDDLISGASYTWSQLIGNQENENSSGALSPDQRTAFPEFVVPQILPVAPLAGDLRHNLKFWLSYDRPLFGGNLNLSLLQQFQSGLPYGSIGNIQRGRVDYGYPEDNGGYVRVDGSVPYYFENPGTYRTDDLLQTDLAVNYDLPLGKIDCFIRIDLFNLFNQDGLTNPGGIHRDISLGEPFNIFTETPVEGVHWNKGTNFGQARDASAYQAPREFRFDLGLRF